MGFVKSLRSNLAGSKQRTGASSAGNNYNGSQSGLELDSKRSSSPASPPRSDSRASHHASQFCLDEEVPAEDVVSTSIARASSRRSIDYAAPGGSSRGGRLRPTPQRSLAGPGDALPNRKSLDEARLGRAAHGRSMLGGSDHGPPRGRTASLDEPRPGHSHQRISLDEPNPRYSSRGSLGGSSHRGQVRRGSLDETLTESVSKLQSTASFKAAKSASRSDWYGPSRASPTAHLPSLNNHDHPASRPSSLQGTRSLRFSPTSSVGDEVPAGTSVDSANSRRRPASSRAVNPRTGDVSDTSRNSLDIGHFSRDSIADFRNDISGRASQSMYVGSHKSAVKFSQSDNTLSLVGTSDGPASGHDPRQRAAVFEETMEKLFHIEGDYFEEKLGEMARKEEEEQKQRDADNEAERFARAQSELHEKDVKNQELWQKLRNEKAKLTVGGIGKLVMKMKGLKAEAHGLVEIKKMTGSGVDLASVDAAKEDIETERKLEAVFSSFCQFGKWDPQHMVLPQHDVKGMGGLKFLSVCRQAGLVDADCVTPRLIRDLFSVHMDAATSLLSFQKFVIALTELSELMPHRKEEDILKAVMRINAEGIMHIHAKDYDLPS